MSTLAQPTIYRVTSGRGYPALFVGSTLEQMLRTVRRGVVVVALVSWGTTEAALGNQYAVLILAIAAISAIPLVRTLIERVFHVKPEIRSNAAVAALWVALALFVGCVALFVGYITDAFGHVGGEGFRVFLSLAGAVLALGLSIRLLRQIKGDSA